MSNVSVCEFYKGRSVLVTGGTGFMGKVLIEKLLYSVPDIGNIYVLMRPKRGKSVAQRLEDLQRLPVFDRIRNERPSAFKKIKALQGDVLFVNLGLSEYDIAELSKEVTVIFHFAATLKLEAPLKANVDMNTAGTLRALTVAQKMKNLAVFVHLSTAFCYPDYEVLGEKLYAPPAKPADVMRLVEWLDDKQLLQLTPSLLGPHPNCYTYSKRLAENLVQEAYTRDGVRAVIARPSIVCPAFEEPVAGWVDSLNGPVGVMLGAGKGVIRTMLCDGTFNAQVIPVDAAINGVICIGAIEGAKQEKTELIPVYNLNVGHQVPTTWYDVLNVAKKYGREYPLQWPLWYPNGDITTNHTVHELKRIFYHLLPAYFIDFLMLILGQKRFMVRIQDRISQGLEVLQFFTMRQWSFPSPNYDSIEPSLVKEEQKIFRTNMTGVDVDKYMHSCVEGGRVYCLKEDPRNVKVNRTYHSFLYVLDWVVKIFFWLFVVSLMASWFEPVKSVLSLGGPVVKHLPLVGSTVFDE
ncbi:hypothetical protein JYU34_000447 [Plutella xylostella]|nr:hypothetical protein JYU34_000447 [Plutella xylostella]